MTNYTYDYADVHGPSFGGTPDPSGGKGENKVALGKSTEVDATEQHTSSTSSARLVLTSSIDDECSPLTQKHSCYENSTKNDHLERQPREHVPYVDDFYEPVKTIKIETNASDGNSNRSNAILSDISKNDNGGGKSNRSRAIASDISANRNQGSKSNRSRAIRSDISKNGNRGGKSNRSRAIRSDIGENGNQVGTDSDSNSLFTTAQESNASSTKSGAEEPSYENLAIPNNDDLGNQKREHNPDDDDIYENSNTIKNVTNISGGKGNRSSAIPSEIRKNGNQVATVSDTASSYETDRESSASSTENGAEASVTQNTTNGQIQASDNNVNIYAKTLIINNYA
jgi:hypothetical protein